jgi:biopolymer transport protein ExbB/TolQ
MYSDAEYVLAAVTVGYVLLLLLLLLARYLLTLSTLVSCISTQQIASLWNERFNELQEYKRQHGNCRVPRKYSNTLHHWVDQQRKYFREGKIHQDRLQRLNEIGVCLCFFTKSYIVL